MQVTLFQHLSPHSLLHLEPSPSIGVIPGSAKGGGTQALAPIWVTSTPREVHMTCLWRVSSPRSTEDYQQRGAFSPQRSGGTSASDLHLYSSPPARQAHEPWLAQREGHVVKPTGACAIAGPSRTHWGCVQTHKPSQTNRVPAQPYKPSPFEGGHMPTHQSTQTHGRSLSPPRGDSCATSIGRDQLQAPIPVHSPSLCPSPRDSDEIRSRRQKVLQSKVWDMESEAPLLLEAVGRRTNGSWPNGGHQQTANNNSAWDVYHGPT